MKYKLVVGPVSKNIGIVEIVRKIKLEMEEEDGLNLLI